MKKELSTKKNTLLELNNINKSYKTKKKEINVLKDLSVTFEKGKFYGIMGHSGSGKSTLINILGLLEPITSGSYRINGLDTKKISSVDEANFRKEEFGFVFQNFCLDEYLKAYENVMFPMMINNKFNRNERKEKSLELLKMVNLENRINHFPKELSGGEQQRVAIARALANNPNTILADEPTGNLDEISEKNIFEILKKLSKEGKCIIVVSHSNEIKKYADVLYEIRDGKMEKTYEYK